MCVRVYGRRVSVVDVRVFCACARGERLLGAFLDPLGREGKPSNIPGGICWSNLVVLVKRADCQSAAGLGPIFEGGRLAFALESRRLVGLSQSGNRNIQFDGYRDQITRTSSEQETIVHIHTMPFAG